MNCAGSMDDKIKTRKWVGKKTNLYVLVMLSDEVLNSRPPTLHIVTHDLKQFSLNEPNREAKYRIQIKTQDPPKLTQNMFLVNSASYAASVLAELFASGP